MDFITDKIIHLVDYIKRSMVDERHLYEMATIGDDVLFNKERKSVQIHGLNSGDREYPHIHIYNHNDKYGFNFEVSLLDLLCYDELILIKMKDQKKHIDYKNRNKCSWNGYTKLRNDFEDWLFGPCDLPGEYKDNLDALIFWYNRESEKDKDEIPILKYISDRGLKIHQEYRGYFDEEELKEYRV